MTDDATNDDEAAQGIDVSMGDGAGATGSGLSAHERAGGLGRARAGGDELPKSKRTRAIGALIVCEHGNELDTDVQIGEHMLDVEPG